MPWNARSKAAVCACLLLAQLSACFVRRRTVVPPGPQQNRPLLTATKDELIQRIHKVSDPIQSFLLKAEMSPSVGRLFGGEVKDYATVGGAILFLKPNDIRVIGQDPVLHTTIFDMASIGNEYRVYIPSKSRFIIGQNDASSESKNKLENLRPIAFEAALLIYPPDPDKETTLLENDSDESKAVYILLIVERGQGELRLARNIYFDRYTLDIIRQKTFDASGNTLSQTRYADWKDYDGVPFPSTIDVQRPEDDYEVYLTADSLKINPPEITPAKFVLEQPPGTQLQPVK